VPATTYVALLRGINVGGNNIIPMAALAKTFERLKLASVRTYIQSGNVIFCAPKTDPRRLETKLEAALAKQYRYDAKVVVRSLDEMRAVIRGMPKQWKTPSAAIRYYVLFLRHAVDSTRILDQLKPKPEIETLAYRPGVLYWATQISDVSRSGVAKLVSTAVYKEVTIRNLRTTTKLAELMEKTANPPSVRKSAGS